MARGERRAAVIPARLRRFCVAAVLVLFGASLWALDLTQGRVKLTLHEGIGRFSLSYLTDLKGTAYKPLLVANDPRTTVLSLAVGNKVYRIGDSPEFREAVEKTGDGARFIWTSPFMVVREEFSFVASQGSPLPDGVKIDLAIKNTSEQDLSVGVRYLLDTYLGEASYVHFRTDRIAEISRELTLSRQDRPQYWISPLVGDPDGLGLMCMLTGPGISVPDRVVFANWKKLSDAPWAYETSPTRTFSLLPYSVNDSAVSHYFDPRTLARGAETHLVTVLGRYAKAGYTLASAGTSSGASLKETLTATRDISDPVLAARADLSTLDQLIAQVDKKLSDGQGASDDELALMDAVVAELRERSGRFTKSTVK
jgi:hypothetical protein